MRVNFNLKHESLRRRGSVSREKDGKVGGEGVEKPGLIPISQKRGNELILCVRNPVY